MKRIAVMVSGGGTNLQAIIDNVSSGKIKAELALVISSKHGAYALERAKKAGIPTAVIAKKDYDSEEDFFAANLKALEDCGAEGIVLAGYMSILSKELVKKFENKIINIHPALIPSFCGKGYYGERVHKAVIAYGAKLSGATVHFVDSGMDTGPIILQKAVEVQQGDTPKSLQQRVMEEAEWKILPQAIDLIAQGRVTVVDGKTIIAS